VDLLELIPEQHRSKKSIQNILTKHLKQNDNGLDIVKRNILYTNNQIKDQRKYRAYLDKAIINDWEFGVTEDLQQEKKQQEEKIRIEKKQQQEEIRIEKEKELKEELERKVREEQTKQLNKRINELSEQQQKQLEEKFKEHIEKNGNAFEQSRLKGSGIDKALGPSFKFFLFKKLLPET
jgi:hypothetical protein